jgi:LCP family protein required for cell wall assembly
MAVLVAATAAYAGYWWYRIDHNFKKAPLHAAVKPVTGVVPEVADAFGDKPLNLLLIGTDARVSSADQSLGGDAGHTGLADVEMLVHISADRSNATVVSIPRDTMVPVPACTDPQGNQVAGQAIGMINSALNGGPGCQVDTVEQLTHVQIDDFLMVDFSGVVSLTNAVGGVPVCLTQAVNDPNSHLNLPAGTSVIQGDTALEFLRTREGFSNGSDLYRTQAQHQYLSALIRKLKSQATLNDPIQLTHLADVASSALTVDPKIAGVTKLLDLADTLKKVPTSQITFMTMPTGPYQPDPNRVSPAQPVDDQIFSLIAHDQSVTAPTQTATTQAPASPTPTASSPSGVSPASVTESIVVENGTAAAGRSRDVANDLIADGFHSATGVGYSQSDVATTDVYYSTGHQAAAEAVATALHLPADAVLPGTDGSGTVVLRVGTDFSSGNAYSLPSSPPTVSLPSDITSQAAVENAGDTNQCVTARSNG